MTPRTNAPSTDPFYLGTRYRKEAGPDGKVHFVEVPLKPEDLLFPQEFDHVVNTPFHNRIVATIYVATRATTLRMPGVEVIMDVRVDFGVEGVKPLGPDIGAFTNAEGINPMAGTMSLADLGAHAAA